MWIFPNCLSHHGQLTFSVPAWDWGWHWEWLRGRVGLEENPRVRLTRNTWTHIIGFCVFSVFFFKQFQRNIWKLKRNAYLFSVGSFWLDSTASLLQQCWRFVMVSEKLNRARMVFGVAVDSTRFRVWEEGASIDHDVLPFNDVFFPHFDHLCFTVRNKPNNWASVKLLSLLRRGFGHLGTERCYLCVCPQKNS